jgi:hypothetical protein
MGIPHALAFTSGGMKIRLVVPRFSAAKTALKRLTTNAERYFQWSMLAGPRSSAAETALKRLTTNTLLTKEVDDGYFCDVVQAFQSRAG